MITKPFKAIMLFVVAFATLSIASCKKDSNNNRASTISAKVDGTATVFNTNAFAATGSVNGLSFTAVQGTAANGSQISVTINGSPVVGKTYSNTATSDDDKPVIMFSSNKADDDTFFNDDDAANQATVTITSASATRITGAFSGGLSEFSLNGTASKKVITEGTFDVAIAQ